MIKITKKQATSLFSHYVDLIEMIRKSCELMGIDRFSSMEIGVATIECLHKEIEKREGFSSNAMVSGFKRLLRRYDRRLDELNMEPLVSDEGFNKLVSKMCDIYRYHFRHIISFYE